MDNKYLAFYNSLNISIDDSISASDAELVAQNAALMHNALGFAIKDLIKIISLKYMSHEESGSSVGEVVGSTVLIQEY